MMYLKKNAFVVIKFKKTLVLGQLALFYELELKKGGFIWQGNVLFNGFDENLFIGFFTDRV